MRFPPLAPNHPAPRRSRDEPGFDAPTISCHFGRTRRHGCRARLHAHGARKGASEDIVVGLIGCGGRGTHDAGLFQNTPNVKLAYVCDVDEQRRGKAASELKRLRLAGRRRHAARFSTTRSVDAVIVATPDHWHSPASILACDAGKHVYVEKPISHNIREGRLLVEAAARNKTLVQHGTQCRSTPMMIEAVQAAARGDHRRRAGGQVLEHPAPRHASAAARTPIRRPASITTPGSARRR